LVKIKYRPTLFTIMDVMYRIKNKKYLIFVCVVATIVLLAAFVVQEWRRVVAEENVLNTLKSIDMEETHLNKIRERGCAEVEKDKYVLTVKNCEDGIYFKVFLAPKGYMLGYCTDWTTPREAFFDLNEVLPIKSCINTTAEDKLLSENNIFKIYEVCGLRIVFREGCIVGINRGVKV